jgi:predicted secreted Zn-dependent protease
MFRLVLTSMIFLCIISLAEASSSKSYSYFTVGGRTLIEILADIQKRGPRINGAKDRMMGTTALKFTTNLNYREANGFCSVASAKVTTIAKITLPRWRKPNGADQSVQLIWNALAADIKRHEDSRLPIANKYARAVERELKTIRHEKSCAVARTKAQGIQAGIFEQQDKAQAKANQVQARKFEALLRKLQKMERR